MQKKFKIIQEELFLWSSRDKPCYHYFRYSVNVIYGNCSECLRWNQPYVSTLKVYVDLLYCKFNSQTSQSWDCLYRWWSFVWKLCSNKRMSNSHTWHRKLVSSCSMHWPRPLAMMHQKGKYVWNQLADICNEYQHGCVDKCRCTCRDGFPICYKQRWLVGSRMKRSIFVLFHLDIDVNQHHDSDKINCKGTNACRPCFSRKPVYH